MHWHAMFALSWQTAQDDIQSSPLLEKRLPPLNRISRICVLVTAPHVQAMLLPRRLRPALRAQPQAGADAAAAVAVEHPGDATLAVSRDPCTTSRSLDDRRAAKPAAADPLARPQRTADEQRAPDSAADAAEPRKEARHAAAEEEDLRLEEGLLEDMQAAVDFARAAYGYAFLCGGMSSIARYLHMQTVQRSTFDIISGVSAEANTQAMCAVAGIPIRDVLLAEWNNTTYRCGPL